MACGAPGSESFFDPETAKATPAVPAPPPQVAQPAAASTVRTYKGYYRKFEDQTRFQPCGTNTLMDITGSFEAIVLLTERFRWLALYEGAKMYAVFRGSIVTDTPTVTGAKGDTTKGKPRTRFQLVGVDSVRVWQVGDCNGMKISPIKP